MNTRFVRILFLGVLFTQPLWAQTLDDIKRLTESEKFADASTACLLAIQREPNNPVYYYYIADKLLIQDRTDSALLMLGKGYALDTANAFIKIGKAKELLNRFSAAEAKAALERDSGNVELQQLAANSAKYVTIAESLIDQVLATAPKNNTTLYIESAEALIRYRNKNLRKAKEILEMAEKIEEKTKQHNAEIPLLYGDIYTEMNNGTLAAEFYNKALALDPTSPRALLSKGRLYRRATNYEGAKAEFEAIIKADPNYGPAYRELGETCFKLGELEAAKNAYKKYLELNSTSCTAQSRYGAFQYLIKDYQGAITQSDIAKSCDPRNPQPVRIAAISYYEMKQYDKALVEAQQVLEMVPATRRIQKDYEYYGKILMANNQDSLGVEQLRIAYSMDPSRTDLLTEIANNYLKNKKYPEALKAFSEKIAAGKDVKSADYFGLGRAQFNTADYTGADASFAKVNEVSPKYASGYLWRARANGQLDTTSANGLAKPFYEKYIELAVADSANASKYYSGLEESYGYLASYYDMKKEKDLSIDYLKRLAQLPIEADKLKNVQQAIKQLEGK